MPIIRVAGARILVLQGREGKLFQPMARGVLRALWFRGVSTHRRRTGRESPRLRLRPAGMTALVARLGFVPVALAIGAGAEVRYPPASLLLPIRYERVEKRFRPDASSGTVETGQPGAPTNPKPPATSH